MQPATTTADARGKLARIKQEMNAEILEREEVVRSMVLALIAGEHVVLLLGPPGTAKSRLARSLCERINGASYFYVCLNRSSLPEEVFGPLRLSALREDRFERNTSGMLPEAQLAFIDEVFTDLCIEAYKDVGTMNSTMKKTLSTQASDWREGRRLRSFELKERGSGNRKQIADDALGVTEGAVSQWMKRAREEGVRGLRHKSLRPEQRHPA